jgi:hypothetical protein
MKKEELVDLIKTNPSHFTVMLKRQNELLYNQINTAYQYPTFSQKLYDYIHNPNKKCVVCGNECKYIGINVGYSKTCSYKCKAQLKHINSIEIRNCVICNTEFEIYKNRKKTTCSAKCLQLLNNTDIVKKKRVDSYKKTIKDKYGVDWYSQTDMFKNKLHHHHISGVFDYNSITDKVKKTKLLKYGSETYNNSDKAKKTSIEKYGVENYSQTIEFKKIHYNRVISRLPNTLSIVGDFNSYTGVEIGKYSFNCNECGNDFTTTLDNGNIPVCKVCNPSNWNSSKFEVEVLDYIRSIYTGTITVSDRIRIKPKELDILLDDINIAIECNGNYWHSELTGNKDKKYHLYKTNECNAIGLKLIHIFEDEWVYKQDIVKNRLKNILGMCSDRIYARNCTVREISTQLKGEFLEKTHLQGNDKSSIKLGIFYKSELVGVMTFSKRKIFGNTDWELVRFSTLYNIVGGASKLFKYFVRNYNPNRVITYSDIRWGDGNVYLKMGFHNIGQTSPGYYYLTGLQRVNRIKYQKHKLKHILKEFDPELSEWYNMQLNGYDRIWDCGHYKYEWNSQF